ATKQQEMQRQLDAIDLKTQQRIDNGPLACSKTFRTRLEESDQFQRLLYDRRGTARLTLSGKDLSDFPMERKAIISATASGTSGGDMLTPVGTMTSGVLQIDRISGITPEARQQLFVRDALFARPTDMAVVDFVKVSSPMGIASPVPEASVKPENSVQFE